VLAKWHTRKNRWKPFVQVLKYKLKVNLDETEWRLRFQSSVIFKEKPLQLDCGECVWVEDASG